MFCNRRIISISSCVSPFRLSFNLLFSLMYIVHYCFAKIYVPFSSSWSRCYSTIFQFPFFLLAVLRAHRKVDEVHSNFYEDGSCGHGVAWHFRNGSHCLVSTKLLYIFKIQKNVIFRNLHRYLHGVAFVGSYAFNAIPFFCCFFLPQNLHTYLHCIRKRYNRSRQENNCNGKHRVGKRQKRNLFLRKCKVDEFSFIWRLPLNILLNKLCVSWHSATLAVSIKMKRRIKGRGNNENSKAFRIANAMLT